MGTVNSGPGLSVSKGLAAKPAPRPAGDEHYSDKVMVADSHYGPDDFQIQAGVFKGGGMELHPKTLLHLDPKLARAG